MTKAESKAIKAIAQTTNNAIEKAAELSRFVGKVLGPSIEDIGAIAAQYTEYWKIKNALRLTILRMMRRDMIESLIKRS